MVGSKTASSSGKRKFSLKRIGGNIVRFFRDLKGETKKIVWPSRKQVINNTIVVVIVMLAVGVVIWSLDWILSSLLKLILGA